MIIGRDIEAILVRLLAPLLPGYLVTTELPAGAVTGPVVALVASGGPELNPHVDQVHLDITVYGPDPETIHDDALKVRALLSEFRTDGIRDVATSYPARMAVGPDESPRRYFYADMRLRKDIQNV